MSRATPAAATGRAHHELRERISGHGAHLAALMGAVALVYSSVLTTRFGFSDDYVLLANAREDASAIAPVIIAGGRPIAALVDVLVLPLLPGIGGLRLLRLVTVTGIGLLACAFFLLLTSARLPRPVAWSAALGCVCVPAYQVVAAWSILFQVPYALLTALCAGVLVRRAARQPRSGSGRLAVAALPGLALLLASMLVYQPAGMAFFLPLAVTVLFEDVDARGLLRQWAAALGTVGSASVLALVVLKIGVAVTGTTGARAGTTTDVLGKAHWYVTEPLRRALDPLSSPAATGNPRLSAVVGVVLAVGAVAFLLRSRAFGVRLLSIAALLPLALLPNLVVEENWASARTLLVLMPLVVLIGTAAVLGLVDLLTSAWPRAVTPARSAALAALALVFAVQADHVVTYYFSVPQARELALASSALQRVSEGAPATVYVRQSHWYDAATPGVSYDEFGVPSTAQSYIGVPMLELLEEELGTPHIGQYVLVPDDQPLPTDGPVVDFAALLVSAQASRP